MLSLIMSVLLLAACGSGDNKEEGSSGQEDVELDMPEADLEGIPDTVAEINGEKITKEEFSLSYEQQFQQAAMQSQMTGEEVDQDQIKLQVAEGMIGQQLLKQEANKRFTDVSEADTDKLIDELVEQNQLENRDEFFAAFEEQGTDKEELLTLIEAQVKIDQLIAEESGDVEPTDEELKEVYEAMKAQQEEMDAEEEIPSFDEMKPDLVEQVKYQKESEVVQTLVEKLREEGEVTIHL